MDRGGSVEFMPGDSGPEPGEDVLELGPRRRPPRWVWLVAAGLVAALVVTGAVTRRASRHPSAVTSPRPSPTSSSSSTPARGQALPLAMRTAPLDIAVSGRTTWILQSGRITALDDLTSRRAAAGFDVPGQGGELRLRVDPAHGALWVIVEGTTPGRVIEFDPFTLSRRRELSVPAVYTAAALNGHLYVAGGSRLIDIAPGAAPRVVATGGASQFYSVVADPTRTRLLVIDAGAPTHLWTYRPGGRLTATTESLPFGAASIAVAAGQIWIGGFGRSGAALLHLRAPADSPAELTPVDVSPLTGGLGPGAVIVAGGQQVFWVRSGDGGADLWCVDAATGRIAQHWNVGGAVASTTGTAVVGTIDGAAPLHLAGCAG